MPTVTTSLSSPQEAIGYVLGSPLNQMEAKGTTNNTVYSAHESLISPKQFLFSAQESLQPAASSSGSFISVQESLITVKAAH